MSLKEKKKIQTCFRSCSKAITERPRESAARAVDPEPEQRSNTTAKIQKN